MYAVQSARASGPSLKKAARKPLEMVEVARSLHHMNSFANVVFERKNQRCLSEDTGTHH